MKKIFNIYNSIMGYLGVFCLLGFIISVMTQVIARTFFPTSPAWTEEAARYLFIYMVAFGCSVAVHKNDFVGVGLLVDALPKRIRQIINLSINVLLIIFCTYVLTQSVIKFAIFKYRMVSTAMEIPMQAVFFSMVILFTLLILSYILELIDIIFFKSKDIQEKDMEIE